MSKSQNKYVSVNEDKQARKYREVATIMSERGDKMNHATVRNIVLRGFTKVAKGIAKDYGNNIDENSAFEIAKNPDFQSSIIDIIKSFDDDETKV